MIMFLNLLYTLAGLMLFLMGMLSYMQTDLNIHISLILGVIGVLVFIVGAIRLIVTYLQQQIKKIGGDKK